MNWRYHHPRYQTTTNVQQLRYIKSRLIPSVLRLIVLTLPAWSTLKKLAQGVCACVCVCV